MIAKTAASIARRATIVTGGIIARRPPYSLRHPDGAGVRFWLLHNSLPKQLDKLMRFVRANRAQFVDFGDGVKMVRGMQEMPRHNLYALTFDDGFRSNLDAARALAEAKVSACFYVPVGVIGLKKKESDRFFRSEQIEEVLDWRDLKEMRALGHRIGSHSVDHVPLSSLGETEAKHQIISSVETLRDKLGSCDDYAWPFGGLKHAPAQKVAQWCDDIGVTPSSGVRGLNNHERWNARHYLMRDNIHLDWITSETSWFFSRRA